MPVDPQLGARFDQVIASHQQVAQDKAILAVSGGSDSTALMCLAARSLDPRKLVVVTVDHGLRPEARDEIARVAALAQRLGVLHEAASWSWDSTGNLQAAARQGRWSCLQAAAQKHRCASVWMGHTEDDQIETALMRLARGSGVDGLRAMSVATRRDDLTVLRPLLGFSRADLRKWLHAQGIGWSDDPTNGDPRFDRVRARQMMAQLGTLGLTRKRLLQTVDHMQAAHVSLQEAARDFARRYVRQDTGDLLLAPECLAVDGADAPRRVLAAAFGWIASRGYRPRFDQLRHAAEQAACRKTITLGGVVLTPDKDGWTRMTREAQATQPVIVTDVDRFDPMGATWDQRWYFEGPMREGLTFQALGEGVNDCARWRDTGLPRLSLLASPSVWDGGRLLAAPVAGLAGGWSARIVADFHSAAFGIED